MQLSARNLAILAAIQSHADRPVAEIAEAIGESEHTVRRLLSQALQDGALRRLVFVNFFELGFHEYAAFFSAGAKTIAQRNLLRDVLLSAPNTMLLLEVGGRFNFGVVLLAPSVLEFESFFNHVVSESRVPITDVHLQVRTGWHYFGAKYLLEGARPEPIHLVPSGRALELSAEDCRVLRAFASSPSGVIAHMARDLGMPAATYQYQLERVQRSGVIAGVRYGVIPEAIGWQSFRALVMTSLPLTAPRVQIMEWARQNPYVVNMHHGVGLWQYELRIEAPNYSAASLVIDELADRFSSVVQSVELIPVLNELKMRLHPGYTQLESERRLSVRAAQRAARWL